MPCAYNRDGRCLRYDQRIDRMKPGCPDDIYACPLAQWEWANPGDDAPLPGPAQRAERDDGEPSAPARPAARTGEDRRRAQLIKGITIAVLAVACVAAFAVALVREGVIKSRVRVTLTASEGDLKGYTVSALPLEDAGAARSARFSAEGSASLSLKRGEYALFLAREGVWKALMAEDVKVNGFRGLEMDWQADACEVCAAAVEFVPMNGAAIAPEDAQCATEAGEALALGATGVNRALLLVPGAPREVTVVFRVKGFEDAAVRLDFTTGSYLTPRVSLTPAS